MGETKNIILCLWSYINNNYAFIYFCIDKSIFWSLRLDFLEKRISEEVKFNYSLNLNLKNIFLKREKSKGFYIEIDKINISQNNLILSTKSIIWDFRVLNLLSLSIDKNNMISSKELKISNSDFQIFIDKLKTELGEFENINILSNEINIRSLSNDIQIQSKNNRLDFNTNSLLNLFTSKFIFSSTLSFNNEVLS